jgi:hypothetical protein
MLDLLVAHTKQKPPMTRGLVSAVVLLKAYVNAPDMSPVVVVVVVVVRVTVGQAFIATASCTVQASDSGKASGAIMAG